MLWTHEQSENKACIAFILTMLMKILFSNNCICFVHSYDDGGDVVDDDDDCGDDDVDDDVADDDDDDGDDDDDDDDDDYDGDE